MDAENVLPITARVAIPLGEIEIDAVRAQGAGGQNVNKSATAVQLRFDIGASSLPETFKERLLALRDRRISKDGVVIIKAQQFRSQEQNRAAALERLQELVQRIAAAPKTRRPTKVPRAAKRKRLENKKRRSEIKKLRRDIPE
ncbi:MAG: aminoacyl-tRNA hydrolase [Caldilineaceae bacterium]|nr:aminoacyl-tRNA hydrolase [Caldilineaceae bacterium]